MRYASIDVLRTLAIVLMVVVHFLENLSGVGWWPGDFGAPLFTFLAGVSFRLWVSAQEAGGKAEADITRVAVRRGLFLFVLGLVFNFVVWLPDDLYNWDVLTLIGTGMMVLAFARHLPGGFLAFVCVVVFALGPFLRLQADFDAHWLEGYFDCDKTLPQIVAGYFATGYFPLIPWLLFPLAGYVAGTVVFPDPTDTGPSPPSVRPLLACGCGFVLVATALCVAGPSLPDPLPATLVKGWTMFPASGEYVIGSLGMGLLLFGLLHEGIDRRQLVARWPGLLRVAGTMSRYSLTVYLLHHVVHLWPLWVYGYFAGDEATQFWREALPVEVSAALSGVCLVASYALFRHMARHEWPSVESVMRWLCD